MIEPQDVEAVLASSLISSDTRFNLIKMKPSTDFVADKKKKKKFKFVLSLKYLKKHPKLTNELSPVYICACIYLLGIIGYVGHVCFPPAQLT